MAYTVLDNVLSNPFNRLIVFFTIQAKKFVESVPNVIKADIAKDEAEKLKETITKVGGTVEIV